jgi:hypothetical protein
MEAAGIGAKLSESECARRNINDWQCMIKSKKTELQHVFAI